MVLPPILERPPVCWTEGASASVMYMVSNYDAARVGAAPAPYGGWGIPPPVREGVMSCQSELLPSPPVRGVGLTTLFFCPPQPRVLSSQRYALVVQPFKARTSLHAAKTAPSYRS